MRSPLPMGQQLRWAEELYHIFCSSPLSCECPISYIIFHQSRAPVGCSGPMLIYLYSFFSAMQTTTLILIICTSALHLYLLTRREEIGFRHALRKGAGSAVAFCMSICVIWPVAALMSYHMRVSEALLFTYTPVCAIFGVSHSVPVH